MAITVVVLLVAAGVAVFVGTLGTGSAQRSGTDAAQVAAPTPGSGCRVVTADVPGASGSGLAVQPLCALPAEATALVPVIQRGGPFVYDKDGTTFRNAERRLPSREIGYYREYTVPTPSSPDRGARRIVAGRGGEVYYTSDHYASFVVVDVAATGNV